MHVAKAATPATRDPVGFAFLGEIGDDLICVIVPDDRPCRHANDEATRGFPGHLPSQSLTAAFRYELLVVLEFDQAGDVPIDLEHDVTAAAAISAVRAALGRVLLATERHRSVPAVSGLDVNFGTIDKHGDVLSVKRNQARLHMERT